MCVAQCLTLKKTGALKTAANGMTGIAKEHLGASPSDALMAPPALESSSLTTISSLVSLSLQQNNACIAVFHVHHK